MRDFQYFTLAPSGLEQTSNQYKFEGGIEAVGDASYLPAVNLAYRFVYDSENEENGASEWAPYTVGNTISKTSDQWFGVQFRNTSGNFSNDSSDHYHIKSTYAFDAGGKIISLINYTDESAALPSYAFSYLFSRTEIHGANELILPDHVSEYCYYNMFDGCTSLQTAPELPATTLASRCYREMFSGCTNFDSVNMKKSMEGIYSTSTHGDTTKKVNYVLD